MNIEANVAYPIQKPTPDVFAAIIDPAKMFQYFISGSSGSLKPGAKVEWEFADVGARLTVYVQDIEENRRIVFDWNASGVKARVTIELEARDSHTTLVSINETGWPMDAEGVSRALGQTTGWTDFLCCMKAYLEHGINLRLGRTKKDH